MSNTHYALIYFSGDFDWDHEDEELCGREPHLTLIGCGPEQFCWDALSRWTVTHPLRKWEIGEVVTRHPSAVKYLDEDTNKKE